MVDNTKLILLAIIAISSAILISLPTASPNTAYDQWKAKYGFTFSQQQDLFRMKIFLKTLQQVNAHNSINTRTYDQGINQFSALTQQEFQQQYLMKFQSPQKQVVVEFQKENINGPNVDWVSYGAVSPVKDQGNCIASYAFSAVGAIEGISVIVYKNPMEYSVQQMIDCTGNYGNNGCNSGTMVNCFNFIVDRSIATAGAYPYIGQLGSCKTQSGSFKIAGSVSIKNGDCVALANALLARPISVAVDGQNFRSYLSGIFSNCGTNLSLAVLLVGMTDSYWTLKNSWGKAWGESGYIRITRGNSCGVCSAASYPVGS